MEIYLVGGAVRDELLGRPVEERDWVVVGSHAEALEDLGYQRVGRDFPVFLHPRTKEEYALARTERKTAPGHGGFAVRASPEVTLEEDLARRDLSVNAMAKAADGRLIDPFGGQQDLAKRMLRHVGEAFGEDPLRVFRVARFAAQLPEFSVHSSTLALMSRMAGTLGELPAERVWGEFRKALAAPAPQRFIEVLAAADCLGHWLPELEGAALPRAASEEATPQQAALEGVTLEGAALEGATLEGATLEGAALEGAVLEGAIIDARLPSPAARYGGLGWVLDQAAAKRLSERLKAPKEYATLASQVAGQGAALAHWRELDGEQLHGAVQAINGFRNPAWRRQLFEIVGLRAPAPMDELDRALNAMESSIRPQDFQAEGLRGAALGQRIKQERIRRLNALRAPEPPATP